MKAISIIAGMRHTHDDAIMRAFADSLEKEGIRIEASTFLLPELLATKGIWTTRRPSRSEKKDIALGFSIAREIGRLGIGTKCHCRWRINSRCRGDRWNRCHNQTRVASWATVRRCWSKVCKPNSGFSF
jgi:hypothetical protein